MHGDEVLLLTCNFEGTTVLLLFINIELGLNAINAYSSAMVISVLTTLICYDQPALLGMKLRDLTTVYTNMNWFVILLSGVYFGD